MTKDIGNSLLDNKRVKLEYMESEKELKELDYEHVFPPSRRNLLRWKLAAVIFASLSLILLVTLIWLCIENDKTKYFLSSNCLATNEKNESVRNKRNNEKHLFVRTNGSDVFEELSKSEIESVVSYLHSLESLGLVHPKMVPIASNYIHSIEMKLPEKDKVNAYLAGEQEKPERRATVFIFFGAETPPTVQEYVVGGIGKEMYAHRIQTDSRQTNVPFHLRPFSTSEFISIFRFSLPKLTKMVGKVLKESYDALPMKCGDKCLKFSMAPVSSAFLPNNTRKAWFWFNYAIEFNSVRPTDFQVLVDMTSVNPLDWEFQTVWYANQIFPDLTVFLDLYENGDINKTRMSFPTPPDSLYGSLNFRKPLMPEEPLRAPRQYEPDGKRFEITENEIHYMNWKTNFRVSTSGGLQLLNIRFAGERIVYEMSMQDVIVMYGGNNPVSRIMNFADGAGMYGTRYRGLLPGVDCPAQAQFVNTYLYSSNEFGARIFENAFCVFEFNHHVPLRRHRAYGRSGAFYGGMETVSLVVRSIISVVNYDYIFDFIFYPTGGMETKVSMTGFLGTSFYHPEESEYGTRVRSNVAAPLHHHLFNFKVDLDIKGRSNRYETLDIKTRDEIDPWMGDEFQTQQYISRSLKKSELNATYKFNFDTPKIHVISSADSVSPIGNPRAYKIDIKQMSKQLMPEGYGFENGIPWARYQMAMTKYKPEEERSSSLFTMWDAKTPVINFQDYLDDDEDLVDQDLVSWITLGIQHLPQTENLPTNAIVGSQLSFLILPFNYFDEDPSMTSRDAVHITPLDKKNPLGGAKVEQYGAFENSKTIPQYSFPKELLATNSTFLFS